MQPTDFPEANQAISFEDESWRNLGLILNQKNPSKLFVLVDRNTKEHCLSSLQAALSAFKKEAIVLEVEAGEKSKDISVCGYLWNELTSHQADRYALLINLGGGMVTDLGGFVAAIYKRGIAFINIPTSLLGMIDASIGGKCGIDFKHYKNQLGVFQTALSTLIYTDFLETVPQIELNSGFAEAIKHALIEDSAYWNQLKTADQQAWKARGVIKNSVEIKTAIVSRDPLEKGERKKLNFGHTLGHALESYFFEKNKPIPHGYAIASGIIMEVYISMKQLGFSQTQFEEVTNFIKSHYTIYTLSDVAADELLTYMSQDKKNSGGEVRFCLLKSIGHAIVDQVVDIELIKESISFYRKLK